MAKPQHTYMVTKGKTKVAAQAADSKARMGASKAPPPPPVEALLKRAKVDPAELPTGVKILEAAKKEAAERIDETTLGKVKKVIEKVKEIAEQYAKLQGQEKQALGELQRPTQAVIGLPDIKPTVGLKEYTNALDVVCILLLMLIKLRAKEKK